MKTGKFSKKVLPIVLSLIMVLFLIPAGQIDASGSSTDEITVYVTVSNQGTLAMAKDGSYVANVPVTLSGENIVLNDVFEKLHEEYYEGGSSGYSTYTYYGSDWADTFWGDASGAFSFYRNNVMTGAVSDESVSDGDYITAFIYADQSGWSDLYTYFDSNVMSASVDSDVTFTLYYNSWTAIMVALEGAELTVYKEGDSGGFTATGSVTDENGQATYTFSEEGTYIVSATSGSVTITAPACVVTVGDSSDNGGEDESESSGDTETPSESSSGSETGATDLYTVLTNAANYIVSCETDSGIDSQWNIFGLARFGASVADELYDTFYVNCAEYLVENDGVLTTTRYTEYSKLILSMTAVGKDAQDISGYNLLYYLSDLDNVTKQGINGPVYALIALNSNDSYEIPVNSDAATQTTEQALIEYILEQQNENGWFGYSDTTPDIDLTAMAVTALAPYYNEDETVTEAIDKALEFLSAAQSDTAGFSSYGSESSESAAQVLVALCALSIDAATDERFIKNDVSLVDVLCSYQTDEGGFSHLSGASVNGIATEQVFYALVAYYRLINGETALFDMNDVSLSAGETVTTTESTTAAEEETEKETTTASKTTSGSTTAQSETTSKTSETTSSSATVSASGTGSTYAKSAQSSGSENEATDEETSQNETEESASEEAGDGWDYDGDYYEPEGAESVETAAESETAGTLSPIIIAALVLLLILILIIILLLIFKKNEKNKE